MGDTAERRDKPAVFRRGDARAAIGSYLGRFGGFALNDERRA